MRHRISNSARLRPVYDTYFADPYVWRVGETYYAVGTGEAEACGRTGERAFPVLRSDDFREWHYSAHALERPDPTLGNNFWAPEVAECDGVFYLYYSVGHGDAGHQLRVAASEAPQGPYCDLGKTLLDPTHCPFAIDPHPFRDEDGQWYLFYARDFLDCADGFCAGTGLAVARLIHMTQLENEGRTVLRPRSDWQRFQTARRMYGQVWDWHTLEGPCVRKHDGRYYCFYSGGRWETDNYGVDYGVASTVLGPYSDAGNETGPRVLRTVPNHLLGPGHNSIVLSPDRKTDYLVFHAWDKAMTARRMFISQLTWAGDEPRAALS